jgi:hypothetical protein
LGSEGKETFMLGVGKFRAAQVRHDLMSFVSAAGALFGMQSRGLYRLAVEEPRAIAGG